MIHLSLLLWEKLHGTCQEVAGRIFGLCDKVDGIYTFIIVQFSQFMCPVFNNTAADFVHTHFTMSSVSWTVQCLVDEWLAGKEVEGNDHGIIEFLPQHRCRGIWENCQHTPYILLPKFKLGLSQTQVWWCTNMLSSSKLRPLQKLHISSRFKNQACSGTNFISTSEGQMADVLHCKWGYF
jgi:hypothetical protein